MIDVLVVDDSSLIRKIFCHILDESPDVRSVAQAASGEEALAYLGSHRVDVVTMDIHMPGMDGFEATRRIMESAPVPIVIVSSCWEPEEVDKTFRAMEAGAVGILGKPEDLFGTGGEAYSEEFLTAVRQGAAATVVRLRSRGKRLSGDLPAPAPGGTERHPKRRIVALGASTGGPQAIQRLLGALPTTFSLPLMVVQHMAPGFSQGFAEWLHRRSPLPVQMAQAGEGLRGGKVYVAPEGVQMGVGPGVVDLAPGSPEHRACPSVSWLFRSVARVYGASAVGILLSGMGEDGAAELKELRDRGGLTLAQDRDSSVVWGMPGEAVRLAGAEMVLSPEAMAEVLKHLGMPSEGERCR